MTTPPTSEPRLSVWEGKYKQSWNSIITPESFSHPAKFARGLLEAIIDHVMEEGWVKPGDHCIDPFGGIATGAYACVTRGLRWTGCELEEHFHNLGQGCDCTGITKADYGRFSGRWPRMRYAEGRYWCPRCLAQVAQVTGERRPTQVTRSIQPRLGRYAVWAATRLRAGKDATLKHPEPLTKQQTFPHLSLPLPDRRDGWRPPRTQVLFAAETASYARNSGVIPSTQAHHYQGNIEVWAAKGYTGAVLLRGDSRNLCALIEAHADLLVSSSPYANSLQPVNPDIDTKLTTAKGGGATARRATWGANKGSAGMSSDIYGTAPGQLGALPPGTVDEVLTQDRTTRKPEQLCELGGFLYVLLLQAHDVIPAILEMPITFGILQLALDTSMPVLAINFNNHMINGEKEVAMVQQHGELPRIQDLRIHQEAGKLVFQFTHLRHLPVTTARTIATPLLGIRRGNLTERCTLKTTQHDTVSPFIASRTGERAEPSPAFVDFIRFAIKGFLTQDADTIRQLRLISAIDNPVCTFEKPIADLTTEMVLRFLDPPRLGKRDATLRTDQGHNDTISCSQSIDIVSHIGDFVSTKGTINLSLRSSPCADGCTHAGGADPQPQHVQGGTLRYVQYGADLAASSPPFHDVLNNHDTPAKMQALKDAVHRDGKGHGGKVGASMGQDYGTSPQNLGNLPPGDVAAVVQGDAAITSPPWEDQEPSHAQRETPSSRRLRAEAPAVRGQTFLSAEYGHTNGQLGNTTSTTFWEAAHQIVSETFKLLRPGAHAVWVTKHYIRDGKLVDFPGDWMRLCQACGFETVHIHLAMLVERRVETHLFEGETTYEQWQESFFRRLSRRKTGIGIEFETVICQVKPLTAAPMPPDEAWEQLPLVEVVECSVSSAPFGDSLESTDRAFNAQARPGRTVQCAEYGTSPAQLGAMPVGRLDVALASPPYVGTPIAACEGNMGGGPGGRTASALTTVSGNIKVVGYSANPANLANLPEGQKPEKDDGSRLAL